MSKFYLALIAIFFSSFPGSAQTSDLQDGSYSVVASFSPHHEDYAQRMVSKLAKMGRSAKYGFDPNRKYWYVYTFQSTEKEAVKAETLKLRGEAKET